MAFSLTGDSTNDREKIPPDLQRELDALDDEDDDDEEEDEEIELVLKQDPHVHQVTALEEQMLMATKELTTIRAEREKQRIQLDQLVNENTALQNQKELRIERIKLQEQMEELQGTIDAKGLLHRIAQEELEQSKTRFRQLQKTLKLLQGGVEHILEQSTLDPSTSKEGRMRASQRQALLKDILKQNWKSQLSIFSSHDDDITDDDMGDIRLFHQKNRRYDSINSMVSEIASISPEDMLLGPLTRDVISHSNRASVLRAAQTLTSLSNREGRSRSRSKFYLEEDRQERAWSLSRSKSASTHRTCDGNESTGSLGRRRRSRSASRKGNLRRTKSLTMPETSPKLGNANNNSTSGRSRRKAFLIRMLDEPHGDADLDSEDTPRTTNTQG